jgi:diaminohydroxyphosphoribosylaminopyrimidine deaminase / 5-amino-6-(5-phosphoribosylamino)uracil reductase
MADGSSKWITGPAAREDVQHWRARAGAILTGADTVIADDPMLTVRLADTEVMPPLRVVLDSRLRSLECSRVREGGAPTLYLHDAAVSAPDAADAEFASVPCVDGRLDLGAVLALLAERGINEVHTEAGATLAGALLRGGWVDELLLYQAPMLLGDNGRPLLAGLGIEAMDQQRRLRVVDQRQVGEDIRLLLRA